MKTKLPQSKLACEQTIPNKRFDGVPAPCRSAATFPTVLLSTKF